MEDKEFVHSNLDFLKPGRIRDAQRRLDNDPNYDPKTLYVPEDFKVKQSPVIFIFIFHNTINQFTIGFLWSGSLEE